MAHVEEAKVSCRYEGLPLEVWGSFCYPRFFLSLHEGIILVVTVKLKNDETCCYPCNIRHVLQMLGYLQVKPPNQNKIEKESKQIGTLITLYTFCIWILVTFLLVVLTWNVYKLIMCWFFSSMAYCGQQIQLAIQAWMAKLTSLQESHCF